MNMLAAFLWQLNEQKKILSTVNHQSGSEASDVFRFVKKTTTISKLVSVCNSFYSRS